MILYVCHEIRGSLGERASISYQKANIELAIQKAAVLKDYFKEIEWVVPHENHIVNELYFKGYVPGDKIVEVECDLIRSTYDGIVVCGNISPGMAKEITAAYESEKFICFIDDVDEMGREILARALHDWSNDER